MQITHSDEFEDMERKRMHINAEIDELNSIIREYAVKKKEIDNIIVQLKSIQMVHFSHCLVQNFVHEVLYLAN